MTHRKHMPKRRHQLTRDVVFQGVTWTVGLGYYDDGSPGEVFIDGPPKHTGSMLDRLTDDLAISLSLNLQLGIKPEKLAAAFSTEPVWINGEESEGPATIAGVVAEMVCEQRDDIAEVSQILHGKET